MKRDTRGFAVDTKSSYWVVGGGWTWSKEKSCFLAAELEEAVGAAFDAPEPEAVAAVVSMATVFDEAA